MWQLRIDTDYGILCFPDKTILFYQDSEDIVLNSFLDTIVSQSYFLGHCKNYFIPFFHEWNKLDKSKHTRRFAKTDISDESYLEYEYQGNLLRQIRLIGLKLYLSSFENEIIGGKVFLEWQYDNYEIQELGLL